MSKMLKSNCDSTVGISTILDEEDTTRSCLRDRVAELEKDSEIISLRSSLRSKEPNPQREKDWKIAELARFVPGPYRSCRKVHGPSGHGRNLIILAC